MATPNHRGLTIGHRLATNGRGLLVEWPGLVGRALLRQKAAHERPGGAGGLLRKEGIRVDSQPEMGTDLGESQVLLSVCPAADPWVVAPQAPDRS